MDYEKKYKEALAIARKRYHTHTIDSIYGLFEEMFPELQTDRNELIRETVVDIVQNISDDTLCRDYFVQKEEVLYWLENTGKQNIAEWSEEDKEAINMAVIALEDMYSEHEPETTYAGYSLPFDKAASRLKTLRPQKQWKPTIEQIMALEVAANDGYRRKIDKDILTELSEQLKRL